jgi:hypothetical protein
VEESTGIGEIEELSFKQLAELLLSTGDLTVEEAEELMGGDIDDSYDQYATDEHLMATGGNPTQRKMEVELERLAERRSFATMTADLIKAVGEPKAGAKYSARHMTPGGNWAYTYSTASGATQRSDNRAKTSTAPAKDKSTQTDSHLNFHAKIGNKDYTIKAKNPRQKALLEKTKQRMRGKSALSS